MEKQELDRDYTTTSIPLNVAERIDKVLEKAGYASRAEFVRDAVRRRLEEVEQEHGEDRQ